MGPRGGGHQGGSHEGFDIDQISDVIELRPSGPATQHELPGATASTLSHNLHSAFTLKTQAWNLTPALVLKLHPRTS